ncbi:hypothetical protein NVP1029O_54 [Vibrio phage 1.029.O._10N.261.55.A7]|nr:hypothetical protein NVP1029O_54 [Vibrio phage 1.029.O._10N.261.55.A7]
MPFVQTISAKTERKKVEKNTNWLERRCKGWRELPNDVAKQEAMPKLRAAAEAKGFVYGDIRATLQKLRDKENEDKQREQVESKPPPPEPKPPPTEPASHEEATGRERPIREPNGFKDIPRGVRPRHEPKVGMNASGGSSEKKYTGKSILDRLDEKRNCP